MSSRRRVPHVHKFGGASLADAAAVRHAVGILADLRPEPSVVVVSAMAGVTDALLTLAKQAVSGDTERSSASFASRVGQLRRRHVEAARSLVKTRSGREPLLAVLDAEFDELNDLLAGIKLMRELTPRTSDYVVARGERLSAHLVAAALQAARIRAEYVEATSIIFTDGSFGQASADLRRTDRAVRRVLLPLIASRIIPVIPGFLGAAPTGDVATLGRGGSDLTASLIGRALKVPRISLWKDVPGFLTADPRVVPDARVIPHLHSREAAELAYYGAKVLHPRALIPLLGRRTTISVRPFADPSASGTEVSERPEPSRSPVRALSSAPGQSLVTVTGNGMLGVPGIAARTFESLHRQQISVSLITQASSEHSISFSVPREHGEAARRALLAEFRDEIARQEIDGVERRDGVATIAVVGLGMAGVPGVAARVFSALARAEINVVAIAQGSSELNISCVVEERDAGDAQRRIHEGFQLAKIGGGAVAAPERGAVILLGFGTIGRTLAGLLVAAARPGLSLEVAGIIDRSGFVFDANGISPRRLTALARAKARGESLADAGGQEATPAEALEFITRHALPRPVLVDVTANDTTSLLRHALTAGMDLVLANKRPLSDSRTEAEALLALARSRGRRLLHEATVGAGLPIIDTCHKLVESGDRVERIDGCFSGTLGYLLSEMTSGRPFSEALRGAMELGYTEPDPREDLSGMDVARKAVILAGLLGFPGGIERAAVESLVPDSVRRLPVTEFLARLPKLDAGWERRIAAARARGEVLRYIATVTPRSIRVGLQAVPAGSQFGTLRGTDNQVIFTTARYKVNPLVITGPGAGPEVTAGGVLNDILSLAPA